MCHGCSYVPLPARGLSLYVRICRLDRRQILPYNDSPRIAMNKICVMVVDHNIGI